MFFGSRGHFNRPGGTTVSTDERLSSEGWQSCASCHFDGLTDSVVWAFGAGPRKSIPLNASFNPFNPQPAEDPQLLGDLRRGRGLRAQHPQRLRARAASPPPRRAATPPPATSTFDPNHGLLIGDNGNLNTAPCVINAFPKANAGRPQLTVTLPGSNNAVPALTALKEWVRLGDPHASRADPAASRAAPSNADLQAGAVAVRAAGLRELPRRRAVRRARSRTSSRRRRRPEIFTETQPGTGHRATRSAPST